MVHVKKKNLQKKKKSIFKAPAPITHADVSVSPSKSRGQVQRQWGREVGQLYQEAPQGHAMGGGETRE